MTLLPKPTGTVAEKDPSAAAVVLVTAAGAPVVVSADATVTAAPGAVFPVTAVEDVASVLPVGRRGDASPAASRAARAVT